MRFIEGAEIKASAFMQCGVLPNSPSPALQPPHPKVKSSMYSTHHSALIKRNSGVKFFNCSKFNTPAFE